ncbi:GSCFA domain protein [Bacteroides sp. 214]|uniref:GSCFA domain-containing protein n=1 Tax=Bacteroides sp. 214 TaxID=2302935 RepID=UPI0013CFDE28|nr:GSCFA domain-containing protein [Bacteroides sp. 214]NDW13021.1 GSCFA domain protein [Bacteroides sp. 214]
MQLTTPIELPKNLPHIAHSDNLLLLGSCFAEHIGSRLQKAKFACDVNPFGILYNPSSVYGALKRIITGKPYTVADLFCDKGYYHSYMHHGSFSANSEEEALKRINTRLLDAHKALPELEYLLITFGTSWIYTLRQTGEVVSNCHKQPASLFERRRLAVSEIVTSYKGLIEQLAEKAPNCKILFTVSPIRHIKDGLHENQLSKATLLLAIDELCTYYPKQTVYFPSYEIVIDELRDYRFYADDMLHPSSLAIDYIWQRFGNSCFSTTTKGIIKACEEIAKALAHRPFNEGSDAHKRFLEQIVLKIKQLKEKYPNLDFDNELDICHTQLNK